MRILLTTPRVSDSASVLVDAFGAQGHSVRKRRLNGGVRNTFHPNAIINWGCSNDEVNHIRGINYVGAAVYNPSAAVNRAANKLNTFRALREANIPTLMFTTNRQTAHGWLRDNVTDRIYCRETLRGHSGEGITVARQVDRVTTAPLYTAGVDTHHEFRFHVMNGVVFDAVRKGWSTDVPESERNLDVRNHAQGSIFVRSGLALERASQNRPMLQAAVDAVRAVGLHFGAVDMILDREGNFYVIEINTACGLTGTTLERYTRAFGELLNNNPMTPWSMGEFSGETTSSETITVETGTPMNISDCRQGMTLTFNPAANSTIRTLTRGRQYMVVRVSNTVVFVRSDRGDIRPYQPRHFELSTAAPAAPVVAPQGPEDGSVRTDVPPNSPERIVRLLDGTSVNVGGTAVFNGTSQRINSGERHTICSIRMGRETGDVFIGTLHDGDTYRFLASTWAQGEVVGLEPERTTDDRGQPIPMLQDINNGTVRVGDNVQVRVGTGGHGLAVGTLGVVRSINMNDRALTLEVEGRTNNVRIHPSRVARITSTEVTRLQNEQRQLQGQQTTTFTIGTSSYRVPSSDIQAIRDFLRRFTV